MMQTITFDQDMNNLDQILEASEQRQLSHPIDLCDAWMDP